MADVHAYEDVLKLCEDVTAFVATVKARGWKINFMDLGAVVGLLQDVKRVVEEIPAFAEEAKQITVPDIQKLVARAVVDAVAAWKAVA